MAGVSREYISRLESGKVALTEEIKVKFMDALERLNPDNPLEMVFDYVRIRFPTQDVKHVVEDILKLRLDVMIHEDFGFYSYAEHYVLPPQDKHSGRITKNDGGGITVDNNQKHIPFAVIVAATNGDEAAIQEILKFYDGYISKLSLRQLYDEYGNIYMVVDSELKGRIQAAVMDMIANFEIIVI